MARSKPGRSASRKSTPVSPPKPPPSVARSTRSATSKQDASSPLRNRATRGTSLESTVSEGGRTLRARNKGKEVEGRLPAVAEASTVEYPELPEPPAEEPVEEVAAGGDSDIVDDDISMTSARTTFTAALRDELEFEELVDGLADLFSASSKLLGMFDVSDRHSVSTLHKQLQQPGSAESVRLRKLLKKFHDAREPFGSSYDINQNVVIQVLRKVQTWEEVGNGIWRPDAILQLANLAEFVANLFPKHRESQGSIDPLAHMHNNFPSPFMNGITKEATPTTKPGLSTLNRQTLALGLDLRTQYLIKQLIDHEADSDSDPDRLLHDVFFADGSHFRGFDLAEYQGEKDIATGTAAVEIKRCVEAIREHFLPDSSQPVEFDGLDQAFPWNSMLEQLCGWAHQRAIELKAEIKQRGGADEIESMLRSGVVPDAEAEPSLAPALFPALLPSSGRRPGPSPRKLQPAVTLTETSYKAYSRRSLDNPKRLLELERQLAASPETDKLSQEQPPGSAGPIVDEETVVVNNFDDDDEPPAPTQASEQAPQLTQSQITQNVVGRLQLHRKESNKENMNIQAEPSRAHSKPSFLDRQENARRVSWDEDESQTLRQPKRKAKEIIREEQDDDDDDEFETDRRAPKARRVPLPQTRVPRTPQRNTREVSESNHEESPGDARVADDNDDEGDEGDEDNEDDEDGQQQFQRQLAERVAQHNAARRRATPVVTDPAVNNRSPARRYETVNAYAKAVNKSVVRTAGFVQRRRPYSEVEVRRIVELVQKHGTSWTLIKDMDSVHPDGSVLEHRSQVDLKDKCRNMVLDYMKSGVRLPRNFERVPLKATDKQALARLGINL